MIFRNNWYCWDEQAFGRIASAIKEEFSNNHAVARGWFFDKHFISSFCLKFFNSLIRKLFCSLWVCFCCQTFCLKFFNSLIRKLFCSLWVCFCCQTFCLKFFNSLIRKLFCSLCVCFFGFETYCQETCFGPCSTRWWAGGE